MPNCPICGSKDMQCGGIQAHALGVHARAVANFSLEVPKMSDQNPGNIWEADRDYYIDENGKVTTDRNRAVTLLVRGGQPLSRADVEAYGLAGAPTPDSVPSAAGLRLARQERAIENRESVTGLKNPNKVKGVIPTGHPAFGKPETGAEGDGGDNAGGDGATAPEQGTQEAGEGAEGQGFSVDFGTKPPEEVQERQGRAEEMHNASEGAGAQPGQEAESKAVQGPSKGKGGNKPQVDDKEVKGPETK